jgi:hypothetical protein
MPLRRRSPAGGPQVFIPLNQGGAKIETGNVLICPIVSANA